MDTILESVTTILRFPRTGIINARVSTKTDLAIDFLDFAARTAQTTRATIRIKKIIVKANLINTPKSELVLTTNRSTNYNTNISNIANLIMLRLSLSLSNISTCSNDYIYHNLLLKKRAKRTDKGLLGTLKLQILFS